MTYPDKLTVNLTIGGDNVDAEIYEGRISYSDVLASRANRWTFALIDPVAVPSDWDEVILYDDTTKILAGYVISVNKERMDGNHSGSLLYRCECASYASRMTRVIVKEEYEDKTDAYIIAALLTEYAADITSVDYVTALKTYERIRFNRKTLFDVLDLLADNANAYWYIDVDKKMHFFTSESYAAPFNISDSPNLTTTFPAADIRILTDGSEVINRVEVVGGNYLSADQTDFYLGTAESDKIQLAFKYSAPVGETAVQMWRNDGTVSVPSWTALTVKVGHIDTLAGADEVLYYYQEQLVQGFAAFPALENALKVTGRYSVPLRYRKRNQDSYDHYGRWFDAVIFDETIISKPDASIAASAKLAGSALANVSITCKVREHGLQTGQTITVTNTALGLTADYLIQRIDAEIQVGGFAVYDLELGIYNKDLTDYIMALVRSSKVSPVWRDDEVLDEVFDEYETLAMTEGTAAVSDTAAPYKWDAFKWSFATWS